MTNDILIWGAGAIGGTVGAWLKKAGYDVTFVDIDRAHVERIKNAATGLHISGPVGDFSIVAAAFTPDELKGKWQRIFLAVKAHHTQQAAQQLAPFLADEGYVLSLQNGLCEATIAQEVGSQRTLGAFINFYADWIGPGEISYSNRGAAVIGELDGSMTPRLATLQQDLTHFEPDVIQSPDLSSWLWGKLAYASLLFAQAVGEKGIADCLAREDIRPVLIRLASEIVQVADGCDIPLHGFNGFDPAAFRSNASAQAVRQTFDQMISFNRGNLKTHSGIWRDLAVRKRSTEVEGQLGVVARLASTKQIACPTVNALIRMIHQIEDGTRNLSDNNLNELLP
jgi:2-dehydropantoate 2-reductase